MSTDRSEERGARRHFTRRELRQIEKRPRPKKGKVTRNHKTHELQGITRIDSVDSATYGWCVRMWIEGVFKSRYFADGKFGNDRLNSLAAALEFRDELAKQIPTWDTPRGVGRRLIRNESWNWVAQVFRKDGSSRTKLFSEARHGIEKAKQLAIAALAELKEEIGEEVAA